MRGLAMPGDVVGHREADDRAQDGHDRGRADGAQRDGVIDGAVEDGHEVVQAGLLLHLARERVQRPEGVGEQDDERAEVDDEERADGQRQQRHQLHAGMAVEPALEACARDRSVPAGCVMPRSCWHATAEAPRAPIGALGPGSPGEGSGSALDLRPGLRPLGVVLADHVRAAVQALCLRGRPVPHVLEVGLVGRRGTSRSVPGRWSHAFAFDGASPK